MGLENLQIGKVRIVTREKEERSREGYMPMDNIRHTDPLDTNLAKTLGLPVLQIYLLTSNKWHESRRKVIWEKKGDGRRDRAEGTGRWVW